MLDEDPAGRLPVNDVLFCTLILLIGLVTMNTVAGRISQDAKPLAWLSFWAHVLAAFAMIGLIRGVFEGGDMVVYHRVGTILADHARTSPGDVWGFWVDLLLQRNEPMPFPGVLPGSSTGSMQALATVLALAFNDSLFAAGLFVALGTFFSKLSMFLVLRRELPDLSARAVAIPCLLVPSVVFWSSGILKEPFAIIGLGVLLTSAYTVARGEVTLRSVIGMAFGSALIALTKPHILPPLCAAAAAWVVIRRQIKAGRTPATTRTIAIAGVVSTLIVLGIGIFFQRFAPDQLAEEIARMQEVGAQTAGGSQYALTVSPTGTLANQLTLVPLALATALFRPTLFEARSFLVALNALEVAVFTWLFLVGIARHRVWGVVPRIVASPTLAFCALFVVGFGVGVGLTTTNLGTLSRYRMPLIPFFGVLLAALSRARSLPDAKRVFLPQERVT